MARKYLGTFKEFVAGILFQDSGTNPSQNGEFRRNGSDVLVYSGGAVRNLSNGGLIHWEENPGTVAQDYSQFLVQNPSGDAGAALTPKGTGPLSADVPDNQASGGDPRGSNSVDWQRNRSASDEVAAGPNSVVAGGVDNKLTSFASEGVIGGGEGNTLDAKLGATIGGGQFNSATGNTATIAGGQGNQVDGGEGAIGGGAGHIVNGLRGVIGGGENNSVQGDFGVIPGGIEAEAYQQGQWAFGGGVNIGIQSATSQISKRIAQQETTDATPENLNVGGNKGFDHDNDRSYAIAGWVVARQVGGTLGSDGDSKAWKIEGVSAIVSDTISMDVSVSVIGETSANSGSWSINVTASSEEINIEVTGEDNKTIRWVGQLYVTEVARI